MSNFFDTPLEQSKVKSNIVVKYFNAWATIMNKQDKVYKFAYIDLYSGPGRYKDGSESTPIKILKLIIGNKDFKKKAITIFNDADTESVKNLKNQIITIDGIKKLKHKPIVYNTEVGYEITSKIDKMINNPALSFIDPWGYKGVTRKLIKLLIKNWGSDCIFFFNYNRVNMAINNPKVVEHVNRIFGHQRVNDMRKIVKNLSTNEREKFIMEQLKEEISDKDDTTYALTFPFEKRDKKGTSHYLILVTKSKVGYNIMKEIMAKYSSEKHEGVPNFRFKPKKKTEQLKLFHDQTLSLEYLKEDLLNMFSGRTMSVKEIYNKHNIGKKFIKKNYKEALKQLEKEGKIFCDPHAKIRKTRNGEQTMGDKVKVKFP